MLIFFPGALFSQEYTIYYSEKHSLIFLSSGAARTFKTMSSNNSKRS